MGDPMRPLMWVSKSQEKLADELVALGHDVSPNTVGRLLVEELAYSRQVNRKTHEGSSHPDRNAQFEHINAQVKAAQVAGQPVISVDTKKKELIGNFRNSGSDYRPKGCPIDVNMHDFKDKEKGKIVPHGIYDPTANAGWVSLGITHDHRRVCGPESAVEKFGESVPMKRPGQPAELATAFVMLAEPLSSYVSGATIAVTGGKPIL